MKFWEKYDLDIAVIIGFLISTTILWATVDEAPDYFYMKHLITCLGVYTLVQAMYALVYFVYRKIKKSK